MFEARFNNLQGIKLGSARFKTQEEAQVWAIQHASTPFYLGYEGAKKGLLVKQWNAELNEYEDNPYLDSPRKGKTYSALYTPEIRDIRQAIGGDGETLLVDAEGNPVLEEVITQEAVYVDRFDLYPDYNWEIIDISDIIAQENLITLAKSIQNKCDNAMTYIIATNTSKIIKGELDSDDIDKLEETFAEVLIALKNFRPDKVLLTLAVINTETTCYSKEEVAELINIIRG